MSFHLVMYRPVSDSTPWFTGKYSPTSVVPDPSITIVNGNYVPRQDAQVVAGLAVAELLQDARIVSPTLRSISPAHIRPINNIHTYTSSGGVSAMSLLGNPLRLRAQEEASVEMQNSTPAAIAGGVALWVTQGLDPIPDGDSFWWNFSVAADVEPIPPPPGGGVWTLLDVDFEASLPSGQYAVIGLEFISPYVNAMRLIFDGQIDRPGMISLPFPGSTGPAMFYDGSLGVFGRFDAFSPPRIEILPMDPDAPGSPPSHPPPVYQGGLRLVRL